jgi:hypothetical protein
MAGIIGVMLLAGSALGALVSIAGPAVAVRVLSFLSLAAASAALRLEEAR